MSEKIIYLSSDELPADWSDFICRKGSKPGCTISTLAEAKDEIPESVAGVSKGDDGFLDIIIDIDCIDEETAQLAIAEALGIDNPEDIVITY